MNQRVLDFFKTYIAFLKLIVVAVVILFVLAILSGISSGASEPPRDIYLPEDATAAIGIASAGTVLSLPAKPTKVFLCRSGSFAIDYVDHDLVITPLSSTSRSNLFVYLYGRRFSFDLQVTASNGNAVIRVHDAVIEPESSSKKAGKTLNKPIKKPRTKKVSQS